MAQYQQSHLSLWQEDIIFPNLEPLSESITTEICIVGTGFAGLLLAYRLLKAGHKVVLLDKDPLGYNESSRTSAHISDAFDDHFTKILKKHGKEKAQLSYQSHHEAIDLLEQIAREENIDCDFKRVDGYLFLGEGDDIQTLQKELEAAKTCGVIEVELLENTHGMFFDMGAALRFGHQAQFHPLKFTSALINIIRNRGAKIFTRSQVVKVHDDVKAPWVELANGTKVTAQKVVMATNVPVNNLISIIAKEAAFRSYVLGIKVPRGSVNQALMWDTHDPYHYIRIDASPERDYDILIVGGEDHRVGQEEHPELRFERIQQWVTERLGLKDPQVVYSWSGQIIEPMDGLAYIGRNPGDKNVFIHTGDSGQGITHAAIGSMILTDLIEGKEHRWGSVYDPSRFHLSGLNDFLKDNLQNGIQYADWIYRDEKDLTELLPGEGCVVNSGLTKTAVYRDKEGSLHKMSAICTHAGGIVKWNAGEETWDCPCHGSRFSKMGEVLNGPAMHNLPLKKEEKNEESPLKKKDDSQMDTFSRGTR
ncbi:FAD-dependent oxidoreductase [Bdellovibrio sp. NC01]|uniref:FAD-dependent oxidoreductase n=1 Tax=Bdellovibrio sp. NC01 TaxID=2220073 RepID=UPI00143CFDF9|nr:FAD-dependent oxidoreductase [Bdellovibrio sp. NC01]